MKLLLFIMLSLNTIHALSKNLVIGVIASSPPFSEMVNTNNGPSFYGFSIDMMDVICQELNKKCMFSEVPLNNQLAALQHDQVDLVLYASPYDPEVLSSYATSLPYLISSALFVAPKNSALTLETPIKHLRIGVIKDTYYSLIMKSAYSQDNQIIPFNSIAELILAVIEKQVDVILLNSNMASYYINNNFYDIKTVSKPFLLGEGYGIVALAKNAPLIKAIDKVILNMQSNGTSLAIYRKYYNN